MLPSHGRETVLVVDDEPEVRRVAITFLRTLGYIPCEAGDAVAALEQLAKQPEIDLLFTDIVLGGEMTGFELAAKARERHPRIAAQALSARATRHRHPPRARS